MEKTPVFRQTLLDELSLGIRTTRHLLNQVEADDWEYRPREGMRTLLELAQHLCQIPAVDLAIMQEHSQTQVQELEVQLAADTAEKLGSIMERGFRELSDYMESLDPDTFLHHETKAFYADHGTPQVRWLLEVVTHVFHHRAQLFQYLKERGHPVNMFDLY
ncbi:DinB family protein [Desmospora profundinema]|uniref:Damage-inducible protein DinB n=1 Tax=Desmospora profundinema TaxID=1571184 RepID=A0ABU1ILV2_9BACL|nr:DinB family protein [Desmospora profundinema]MDR6225748.1 putative damage-inducible protein DinB [Desmospora profundinema]